MVALISWQALLSGGALGVQAGPRHPPRVSSQCPRSLSNGKKASAGTGTGVLVGAWKTAAAWGAVELLQREGSRFLCNP